MSKLRANQLTDKASTGAPTAPNGLVVTGVSTATSFSGSGANLTSLPAGQLTGALPAISGANLTGIVSGILKVKQVKTTAYITSGSSWTDITGLSITITPTAATTQMMIIPNISTYHASGSTQYTIKIVSSNSTIEYIIGDFWSPGSGVSGNITQFYLDDHNTTNAITYKVQHKHYSGSAGTNKDWSGNLNGVSTFTVIEIDSSVIS